ncbi:DUF3040 domain-containing protein [Schaalia sp. lx-260]|uniref:DUF3040 domain-containing protein n=1 Tax=Schaalia sp. lx-260 TaxID=2899082 RepID=UPI001E3A0AE7|nr:DUF3040 domain-containing protein [Schaalia sp. lx-260]MCD4549234.1 DUF3040 domain-containing protein [Schaalia sp. lx-260]
MALSEYEKKVLEQMEADFRRSDPQFVAGMSDSAAEPRPVPRERLRLSPRRFILGLCVVIVGSLLLLTAVSLGYSYTSIALAVCGFVVMVSGLLWMFRTDSSQSASAGAVSRKGMWSRFMYRQQQYWDERQQR